MARRLSKFLYFCLVLANPAFAETHVVLDGKEKAPAALFALPGEAFQLSGRGKLVAPTAAIQLSSTKQELAVPKEPGSYQWLYQDGMADPVTINVFVKVPFERIDSGALEQYRIGNYLEGQKKSQKPPEGFIKVTAQNRNWNVSRSYRLHEFVCKQVSGYPKFVALQPALLRKLERLADFARRQGFSLDKFTIMSGYRTPFYNKQLGNVRFSQHVYGNAADVFVDESPKDGKMDDLNKDGLVTLADAMTLYKLVEKMETHSAQSVPSGGLSAYKPNRFHGPFVHVDARGYPARW